MLGLEMGADDYITKPFSVKRALRPGSGGDPPQGIPFSGSGRGSDLRADLREYGGPPLPEKQGGAG